MRDAIQMFRGGMLSLMQFATVQVRASAGYPEPVQVISECGAKTLRICYKHLPL